MRVDDKGNALSWTTSLSAGYVKIKRLYNDVEPPKKAHESDAGFDLRAHLPDAKFHEWGGNVVNGIKIRPHETVMIGTGIAVDVPAGYYMALYARSGLASKKGIGLANSVGIVDCNYHDEVILPLYNHSSETQIIHNGDRVAQCMLAPIISTEFVEVDEFDGNDRGGGLGSTGM